MRNGWMLMVGCTLLSEGSFVVGMYSVGIVLGWGLGRGTMCGGPALSIFFALYTFLALKKEERQRKSPV